MNQILDGKTGKTRGLYIVAAALTVICFLVLFWGQYRESQARKTTDQVVNTLVADNNRQRAALAQKGVDPNSVAPPPQQRTAPLQQLPPVATGPSQAEIAAAVNAYMAAHPPPAGPSGSPGAPGKPGEPGKNGESPACLSEPSQCQGSPGAEGKDGANGKDGEPGRGVASIAVSQEGDTCRLTGTYSDGTAWDAGTWSCAGAPSPSPSASPLRKARRTAAVLPAPVPATLGSPPAATNPDTKSGLFPLLGVMILGVCPPGLLSRTERHLL